MKKWWVSAILMMALMLSLSLTVSAGDEHYVNGVEGIKASSLPPAGYYWKMYNLYYSADKLADADGNEVPIDFEVKVYALVNRFLWMTGKQVLGGDFGVDLIVPVVNTDLSLNPPPGPVASKKMALGDIYLSPLVLSWHQPRYDAAVSVGIYLPTGKTAEDGDPANPGKGYWTTMVTLGATYYLDQAKLWSAAVLPRYEIHGKESDAGDFTAGHDFHFEWGLGKMVPRQNVVWDIGLAGYCHWQVTDDSGADADPVSASSHDGVFAVGPEVMVTIPKSKLILSLRGAKEFGSINHTEGLLINLTMIKIL